MIPIYNTWCICVMHDIQIVLMWTTSNFALHYSYKYYIIIHIYIIILYHFVYIISVNTKTSLPLHNLDSKIIVWRWSQIEALLVTNRAGSQIEALCGHKSCRSHKLKRVTNRAVTGRRDSLSAQHNLFPGLTCYKVSRWHLLLIFSLVILTHYCLNVSFFIFYFFILYFLSFSSHCVIYVLLSMYMYP